MAIESLLPTTAKLRLHELEMHSAYVATDGNGGNDQKTRRM